MKRGGWSKRSSYSIVGDEEIKRILDEIAPRHASNLMRATVQGIASTISKRAKEAAPFLSGDLRKSIIARPRKSPADRPVSNVIAYTGPGRAPYWRAIERGTKDTPEQPYIRPAYDSVVADMPNLLREMFATKLEAALKRAAKRKAKLS